jgi:hypothetical protein
LAAKKARNFIDEVKKNEGEWKDEFKWPSHSTTDKTLKSPQKQAI